LGKSAQALRGHVARSGWGGRVGAGGEPMSAPPRPHSDPKQREPRGRQRNAAQRPSFLALANPRSLPRWSPLLRKKETKSEGSLGPWEFGIARRDASKGAFLHGSGPPPSGPAIWIQSKQLLCLSMALHTAVVRLVDLYVCIDEHH